jgi:aminoglycoside 3-N-acetyltransferase I
LIGELGKIASERNVYVIFVQADTQDAPAIALYESLGTKETAHHFESRCRHRPPGTEPQAAIAE